MTAYKCAPGCVISTSLDPDGTELTAEFDKDGMFRTDNFHLITVLDALAADPNSPVAVAGATPKKAVEPSPEPTTTEEDVN